MRHDHPFRRLHRRHRHAGRRTQPYRQGNRQAGGALKAMLRGRPAFMANPMDARRRAMKKRGNR